MDSIKPVDTNKLTKALAGKKEKDGNEKIGGQKMEKVSLMGCWEPPRAALAALLLWVLAPREGRTVKLSIKFSQKHMEELLVQWGSVKWS